ncbi:hypothetical protein SprV_0100503700 [Sparganum proliferum]
MQALRRELQIGDKLFKEMFLERLPADVQTILPSASEDLSVSRLAEMAEKMLSVQRFQPPSVVRLSISSLLTPIETGKPVSQGIEATVFSGPSGYSRTFYMCGNVTRRHLRVDTEAQISIVPSTSADRRFPSPGLHLQVAKCSPILTFDSQSLTLNIGLRRSFSWIVVIADVPPAILGSDFLAEFDFLVDCRRSRLLDRTTGLCPPVFARPRRLAPARFQVAKAEFEHMLQLGIIRQSESPWASPLHMVPKATSGDWRPYGDYRALNNATIPDRYPVPHFQAFAGALFGNAVFTKIDLFIRMPFGLHNAAQTSQRFIDHVLRGLPFVYAYVDDLLASSRNEEEQKGHLAWMFDRLDKLGVVINRSKCVLGVPSHEFLGHQVHCEGLRPLPSKVEAMRDFPPPTSKRQLQRFIDMAKFYRQLLLNCADLLLPLANTISGPKGPLELTGEGLTTFGRIKNSPVDATSLTHHSPEAQLSLMEAASTEAVGAVLQQHLAGSIRRLAFFSKKLLPAETRYSTFDREVLAIYLAVKHF